MQSCAPVQGNGSQCEDAGVHGEEDEEVHGSAEHRTEHPLIQGVNGGLKRHAEYNKAQISHPKAEDEHVGGLGAHLAIATQNCEDQRVPRDAEQKDEGKTHGNQYGLRFPLRGVCAGQIHISLWLWVSWFDVRARALMRSSHRSLRTAPRPQVQMDLAE